MKEVIEIEMIDPLELTLHKSALSTPKMNVASYDALKSDIEINGQLEAITLYRGKIIDGRHRWLIAQDLGMETMKCVSLPNNTKLMELDSIVQSKENRRHETPSQLAIRAYRLRIDKESQYSSFSKAASAIGANPKRVSEAKKIAEVYGRLDILEILFNGEKFNTGSGTRPFYTDSLGTINVWLEDNSTVSSTKNLGISPREELTSDESLIVADILNVIRKESKLVQAEISRRVYHELNISGSE